MAVCPKCQKKIPFYHLGQMCPHCGVNMRFYNFDVNFYRDAKRAELSLAKTSIFISHVKASFIGSVLTKVRLGLMLLPVISLLAPFANAAVKLPFVEGNISVSGLGLYNAFSQGYVDFVLAMIKGGADADAFKALLFPIGALVVLALLAVIILLLTILSFASIKKMHKVLCGFGLAGVIVSVAAGILSFRFASVASASAGSIITGSASFGAAVAAVAFGANFVINLLIVKKGYNIEYKEGVLERAEIAKKIKSGEINLDDLPQPVVETEETREIDREIERQQQLYREKEGGAVIEED